MGNGAVTPSPNQRVTVTNPKRRSAPVAVLGWQRKADPFLDGLKLTPARMGKTARTRSRTTTVHQRNPAYGGSVMTCPLVVQRLQHAGVGVRPNHVIVGMPAAARIAAPNPQAGKTCSTFNPHDASRVGLGLPQVGALDRVPPHERRHVRLHGR
jgi:hypothetical protein